MGWSRGGRDPKKIAERREAHLRNWDDFAVALTLVADGDSESEESQAALSIVAETVLLLRVWLKSKMQQNG